MPRWIFPCTHSDYLLVVLQKSYTDTEVICLNKEHAIAFFKGYVCCVCVGGGCLLT